MRLEVAFEEFASKLPDQKVSNILYVGMYFNLNYSQTNETYWNLLLDWTPIVKLFLGSAHTMISIPYQKVV